MANYRYTATDAGGRWISGEAEGPGPEAVEGRLRAEGLAVESLVEAEPSHGGRGGRISGPDAVELVQQLAGLARSGLPLPSGLRASAEEVESPALRSVFRELADRVEAGGDLGSALASKGDRFPAHLRGLVLAGARSGRLADVLAESVRVANLNAELRRKFWSVITYPLITAGFVLALVVFISSLSVWATEALLGNMKDFGIQEPAQSAFLARSARLVSGHWHEALIGGVVLGVLIWAFLRITFTPAHRRRMACDVPVVGPALRYISLTEFCRLLAMLLEAQTPMPEALAMAGRGVGDAEVAEASERMARSIAEGQPLSKAVRLWDSIPAGLGQLLQWSEANRSLPESLRMAGDMFEARARSQSAYATNFLNTLLVLLILWLLGFALAALYAPLLTMLRVISALSG